LPASPSAATLTARQTLDALPAHVLTPFNGSVPPANLLDKIARGVAHAKGAEQWPHAVRATRAKLLELARTRAREERLRNKLRAVEEHNQSRAAKDKDKDRDRDGEPMQTEVVLKQSDTNSPGPARAKRPLYRQSSMDFMQSARLSGSSDRMAR
jgi:hypothetical protein